jgi:hypothetical protein
MDALSFDLLSAGVVCGSTEKLHVLAQSLHDRVISSVNAIESVVVSNESRCHTVVDRTADFRDVKVGCKNRPLALATVAKPKDRVGYEVGLVANSPEVIKDNQPVVRE